MLSIFINNNLVAVRHIAYKIPERTTNQQFVLIKELQYPTLISGISFSIAIICGSKIYLDFLFRPE